ncbi:MAG TPA: TetR/AcrR family transcriptional regulator [Clostridia bacterium]|jgi:AcrR family transcriptional regulator|nr:TetR/AcrR family transcriptional regulator [Clostridia bacterium]HUM61133.1 TetR/AcrR family transcriptional regulator [Clostridia bacterium]
MNKQESRYAGTASLMDEALLLLLEQKDFDRITVKELCQKAGVNRTTFYLHYQNMNDLLEETVEMINRRFRESLSSIPSGDTTREILTSEKYLRPYLGFIKENMRAYRVIHLKDKLFQSQKTFESMYQTVFSPALSHFGVSERERKYVFAFYTQGTVAIIGKWIEDNCRDDIDMIIELIARHTMASRQEEQ